MSASLRRGQLTLFAFVALATAALATSSFLLWTRGLPAGSAILVALQPSLLLGAIGLASRFLCRSLPLRGSSAGTLILAHAGSAAAASGLWVFTFKAVAPYVAAELPLLFGLGMLLVLGAVAVHYLLLEVDFSREAESAALRYRVLAREAELRAFKAQLDPHFLFNSLNSIASLCGSRPEGAREMTQRLAEFFRLVLRLGALDRIPLSEEMDLVSRYLSIEKVRFGDRLDIRLAVDDGAAACMIPPLLLQPLVENAVRHGIAEMVDGGAIEITATTNEEKLHIRIENPADPDRGENRGEGIGLRNAQGRLSAVTEGRAMMNAVEAAGRYRVDIEMPR